MTEVYVAAVAAVGAVIVAMIERVRRQNSREHDQTGQRITSLDYLLGKIDGKLDHVHDKITTHLDDHRSNQ